MEGQAPSYQTPNAEFYQPLSSPDSIRVLTIFECDNEDDDIECHLAEIRLSEANDETKGYTALSYAWGDLKFTHEIWLGDQRFLIGANLDAAIRHLRRQDRPVRLWIDAVCINQGDIIEKNHQVQQMRKIFSAASETIIWLGEGGGNTSVAAWNFLERHSTWALNDRQERDHTLPARLEENLLSFRGEFRDVEIDVLSRPWFKRLWVFQEAVLSRALSVQCGYRRIAWDDFSKTVIQSERHHDRYGFSTRYDGKKGIVRDISRARCQYLQKHGLHESHPSCQLSLGTNTVCMLNILRLLRRGRFLEASDARDKIFGFMGIAEGIDPNDPRFRIDYRLDTRSLYTQFARNMIETTDSLDILSYVSFSASGRPIANTRTSSWAPCWDYHDQFASHGVHCNNRTILDTLPSESDKQKTARRSRISGSNITWSHLESDYDSLDSMEVSGRVIGRIGALSAPIRLNRNDHVLFRNLMDADDDDFKMFALMMGLWARKLTSKNHGFDAKADMLFVNKSRGTGVPWDELDRAGEEDPSSPKEFRRSKHFHDLRNHLKQATIYDFDLSVQDHLYLRGQAAANWSGQPLDRDIPSSRLSVTDDESIVDGRKLGICVDMKSTCTGAPEELAGQIVLVPSGAEEGDTIIQISGARVPFVVRKQENDWSDFPGIRDVASLIEDSEGYVKVMKSFTFPWELIGDCLLNEFDELADDAMDTRFRLV